MMKRTRVLSHLLLAALCLAGLFAVAGCEAVKPAVPEAIITQPSPSAAIEAKTLDLALTVPKYTQNVYTVTFDLGDLFVAVLAGIVFVQLDLRNRNDIEFIGDLHEIPPK